MKKKKSIKFFQIYDSLTPEEKDQFHECLGQTSLLQVRVSKKILKELKSGSDFLNYLDSNFSERSIWNICSELTKTLVQYMAFRELIADDNHKTIEELARKHMNRKNLDNLLIHEYRNSIKKLLGSGLTLNTFREVTDLSNELLQLSVKTRNVSLQRESFVLYKNFMTLFFLYEIILEMYNNEVTDFIHEKPALTFMEEVFPSLNFDSVLRIMKRHFPDFYPIYKMHYDIYVFMSKKGSLGYYRKIKKTMFDLTDRFSDEYKTLNFQILVECLIRIKEENKFDVDRELFELFSKKIKAGLIHDLKQNKIGYNHFRDHILIALNAGETQWAEDFIENYSGLLPESQKQNDIYTGYALINLKKNNYTEALQFIEKIRKTYYIHYNDFFRVSIKANFGLGNYNECLTLSEKYRDYLRRTDKLSKQYIRGSRMFLKNVRRLVNYKFNSDVKYLNDIEYDLLKRTPNSDSSWIENKLNENLKRKPVQKAV